MPSEMVSKRTIRDKCITKLKDLIVKECESNFKLKDKIQLIVGIDQGVLEQLIRTYIQKYNISEDNVQLLFENLVGGVLESEFGHVVSYETKSRGIQLCKLLLKAM